MNDAPEAEDAAIFPSVPLETDNLTLSYVYIDIENNPESGTEIVWYMNGVEQESFSGMLVIPSDATSCDEQWFAVVTPSDGIDTGESVESNSVTVCGTNSPPEWSDIEDQHILEDSGGNEISMEGLISDDEQALIQMTFIVESNSDAVNLGAEFSGSTLTLTTLTEDYNTSVPIVLSLSVSDGEYTVFSDMNVFIDPVNDAPVLSEIGTRDTYEDTPLTINLSAEDIDGDDLSFSVELPPGADEFVSVSLSVDNELTELTLTPAEDFYGDVQINVSVTDGEYELSLIHI